MDNLIYLLMFVSAFCLFLAVAEMLALVGVRVAMIIMSWYDDYTCWKHIQRKRRFWKRVKRGEI